MLLHDFTCTLTAYKTDVFYAVTKKKKTEMPRRVLLPSGMRLQTVTQQLTNAPPQDRLAATINATAQYQKRSVLYGYS